MKLALGTVQFGLPYGIANTTGQVDIETAADILSLAKNVGVDTLDTAIAYGGSEKCLGKVGVDSWKIITKLPEVPMDSVDATSWVNENIEGSISRLGTKKLTGLLLHRPGQLLETQGQELWNSLQQLKLKGTVDKIGFSIYSPDELDGLWDSFHPDLVQVPFNILDRRLITSGWLARLDKAGVEVHVRSVFLQGLLLMDKKVRPAKFDKWSKLWQFWEQWLQDKGITALQASLAFALSEPKISRVVVGVDSLSQFEEILSASKICLSEFPDELNVSDSNLLNPSFWNSL